MFGTLIAWCSTPNCLQVANPPPPPRFKSFKRVLADYASRIHLLIDAVTATLLNFVRMFGKSHDENCKQAELEKKKAQKEVETEKAKGINQTKKVVR